MKNRKTRSRNDTSSKAKKVKKIKRQLVPRTRNLGTMTEVEYFGKIRSSLRRAFRFWKPMQKALELASRPAKNPKNPRLKKEFQCAKCKNWFKRTEVEIDHIKECGSLMSLTDIPSFVERMTPEDPKAFQVLCKAHHKEKTKLYLKNKKDGIKNDRKVGAN